MDDSRDKSQGHPRASARHARDREPTGIERCRFKGTVMFLDCLGASVNDRLSGSGAAGQLRAHRAVILANFAAEGIWNMPTNASFAADPVELAGCAPLHHRWGWLLLLGIVQLLSGVLALLVPVAASLAAAIVFGAVLFTSGAFQLVHAFTVGKSWSGLALQALGGLLYVGAGVLVLLFPLTGAITLALIVGALLVGDGVVRSTLAVQLGPHEGRWTFLAGGIASALVGILLLVGWPLTGVWAIGILLGVNLIFSGVVNSALAFAFRSRVARAADGVVGQ